MCPGEPGSIEVLSGVALSRKDAKLNARSYVSLERRRKRSLVGRNLKHAGASSPRLGRNSPNRCSSRPPPPRCSRSAGRFSNSSRYCKRWSSSAARPCDADKSNVTRQIDSVFYRAVSYGFSAEFVDRARKILPLFSIACAGMCRLASASSIAVVAMS